MNVGELKRYLDTLDENLPVCIGPPWSPERAEELTDACLLDGEYNKDTVPKTYFREKIGKFVFIGWPGNYNIESMIQDAKIISCASDLQSPENPTK